MTTSPAVLATAQPLSVAARPDLTGGRRIGVLVQHGFTGSPGSMRAWGEYLAARGYAVEVPRLPGHGTHWKDLNTTTWADWYAEVCRAFDKLAAENDAVVLAGLSMGGALVLRLAADAALDSRGERIAGVVVVNPAVALKRWDLKLLPLLKHVVGAFPGIDSDIKKAGVIETAYKHTPLKAAHSMVSAWPVLVADLGNIKAPLLYFRSAEDHVVDELSEPLILDGVGSTDVTVTRLENSYHVATMDNDAERIFEESAAFVARVTAGA